jgi:hypothetical protein
MTPQAFVRKWAVGSPAHALNERAGAQAHFIDLCRVLGVPEPADPDAYCFERGVTKTGSAAQRTDGFADVWMRGHFAWEYKAPGKSLGAALQQLMRYALPLENPPLLVVSDRQHIEVHTHFTGTPSECHTYALEDITRPDVQQRLRALWTVPDSYKPARTNRDITEDAARTFAATAERLRAAGVPAEQVSHFLTQCLFCFFAEDVGLLPQRLFERLVGVQVTPELLRAQLGKLFEAMRDGGLFGVDAVPWFNGGLFKTITVPPLQADDVAALKSASALNWSAIDPSIFGTLFERGLDPGKRSQLGAHYTDPATILRLVDPVVQRPLADTPSGLSSSPRWTPCEPWPIPRPWPESKRTASATRPGATRRPLRFGLPGTAARLPRAGPGLRQRQLPVPGAQGPEGHRAPGQPGSRATGPGTPARRDRPAQRAGHRAERIRRRTGACDGVDR